MELFKATFMQTGCGFKATFGSVVAVPGDPHSNLKEMEPPIWTNAEDIKVVAPDPLADVGLKEKVIVFPTQRGEDVETFDVPKSLTVDSISTYSVVFCQFYDCSWEFDKSEVTHPNAKGEEIEYWRYKDNRGYAAGERTIKVTWK